MTQDLIPPKKPFTWQYQGQIMLVDWQTSGSFRGTDSLQHLTIDGHKTLCGRKLPGGLRYNQWDGRKTSYMCKQCSKKV